MGQKQSVHQDQELPKSLWCSIDYEWSPVSKFRVLACGHYYCVDCLQEWARQEMISCPDCRQEDDRQVLDLDNLDSFKGKIYFKDPPESYEVLKINNMLHHQMMRRAKTIR